MSHETPYNLNTPKKPSQEDIDSAIELIEGEPLIRNHPRILQLIETDFVTEDGRQLDPGDFIAGILDMVESGKKSGQTHLSEDIVKNAMAEHSKTWMEERD